MTFTAPQDGSTGTVVGPDLMVCSGIVHAIDAVLVRGSDMAELDMAPPATPAPAPAPVATPSPAPVAAPEDDGMADLADVPTAAAPSAGAYGGYGGYAGAYGDYGAYGGDVGGVYGGATLILVALAL